MGKNKTKMDWRADEMLRTRRRRGGGRERIRGGRTGEEEHSSRDNDSKNAK